MVKRGIGPTLITTLLLAVSAVSCTSPGGPTVNAYSVSGVEIVECAEETSFACGRVDLESGDRAAYVEFVVEGSLEDAVLLWLPGGPNDYATALYAANRPEILASFPQRRIVVVDPPRETSTNAWLFTDCLASDVQGAFFDSLTAPTEEVAGAAATFAEACVDEPGMFYTEALRATILSQVVKFLDSASEEHSPVDLYAASADVRLASELAASGLRFRDVVLESAVPTSNSGLSYLATRATSAKNAFLVGVDTTVVDDSVVDRLRPEDVAYLLSVLRVPALSPFERASLLVAPDETAIGAAADQYFRRYEMDEYSGLNGLYYATVCTSYEWPDLEEFLDAERSAEAGGMPVVARFIFNYHLPCVTWGHAGGGSASPPSGDDIPAEASAVIGTTDDSLVGGDLPQWSVRFRNPDPHVYLVPGIEHASAVALSGCTIDELVGTVQLGDRCGEYLSNGAHD